MLYILSGQDDFSLNRSLEEIKKGVGDQAILGAVTTTLDGQQVTLDQLRTVCQTAPFLASQRLVIINGLLERFEARGRPGRQKKTPEPNKPSESELFGSCICQIPNSTVLVLVDAVKLSGNNPLLKQLSAKAVVKSFPLLRGKSLTQWIQKQVKEAGGSISPAALELLAKLVGGNLWAMNSEITKLVLYASGRSIEEADVNALTSYAQEVSVFTMVDAILESRAALAEQLLQRLLQGGAAPAYLLFMLSRQVGMIVRAKELKEQNKPDIEIQHALGLSAEFAFRKTLAQAALYSLSRLKQVYRQLLETDISIKVGRYDAELALDILVAELCQRSQTQAKNPVRN